MRGNTALEFGVVPEALARVSGSLHKQLAVPGDTSARPTGFASHITAGSTLPFRVGILMLTPRPALGPLFDLDPPAVLGHALAGQACLQDC